jgi:D-serine deaminase-like pyridoxal phosphate-dependent protein
MSAPSFPETSPDAGTPLAEVETPALVVDLDVMERNLDEYASFADEHDVRLRSHTKTHKIPDLARRQHDRTGGGILCQTLSEAEVMARRGIDDIYLSYMVVEPSKLDRLVALADRLDNFATTVDSRANLNPV